MMRSAVDGMLELDLQTLGSEGVDVQGTLPREDGPWADTDLRFAEPPRVDLHARPAGERDIHVTGTLDAKLTMNCRRCLEEMNVSVQVELGLFFDPTVEKEGEEEQVYALEAEAHSLDLAEPLREQLLLEVPPYPLCGEDCEGLCPKCGTNLNVDSCDCTLEEPDPRWDALRELQSEE